MSNICMNVRIVGKFARDLNTLAQKGWPDYVEVDYPGVFLQNGKHT